MTCNRKWALGDRFNSYHVCGRPSYHRGLHGCKASCMGTKRRSLIEVVARWVFLARRKR